jgi:hypothetical protein
MFQRFYTAGGNDISVRPGGKREQQVNADGKWLETLSDLRLSENNAWQEVVIFS